MTTGVALFEGLAMALNPTALALVLLGSLLGMFVGIIPGIGAVFCLAVILPFTFQMDPAIAFALLMGIYSSTPTGGSITAVLINTPGTGPNAATTLDGFPMTLNGQAGCAVGAAVTSSAVGGVIGAFTMALCVPFIRPIILMFRNPEFFMMALLGIIFIAILGAESPRRGIIAGGFGLVISLMGNDPVTGIIRFVPQSAVELYDGLHLVPVAVGLFAGAEMLSMGQKTGSIAKGEVKASIKGIKDGILAPFRHIGLTVRCSMLGTVIGAIPGLGGDVACFLAYGHAKQTSKHPETFGKGNVEGVIGPESANNAKEGGSLLPTLAFGVPGSAAMAILLGAFLILGVDTGPKMLNENLPLTFMMAWDLAIGNIFVALACLLLAPVLIRVAYVKSSYLVPSVMCVMLVGAYAVRGSFADVVVAIVFSIVGYVMKKYDFPRASVILGLVLGRIFEVNLHISNQLFGWTFFLNRPISLIILAIIVVMIGIQIRAHFREKKEGKLSIAEKVLRETDQAKAREPEKAEAPAPAENKSTWGASLLFCLFFALIIAVALTYPARAQFVPMCIAIPGLAMSVWELVVQFVQRKRGFSFTPASFWNIQIRMVLLIFLLGAAVYMFGFIITIPIFLFAYIRFRCKESWLNSSLCTIGVTAGILVLFQELLRVRLYEGLLFY